ncbi:MAG: carbamoyl phosphate synthase-like protein [Methanosaeta sp. PtaB.Bin018]|nr:MAG: carbamoyl phosphate synthase-like protein [Methanosaeta sp. PtaB.Bin018]OPY44235.1 MAG: carbamoyl phosphate synthase-like protein [Methanosaeta sp. PtaU1.Bin016]
MLFTPLWDLSNDPVLEILREDFMRLLAIGFNIRHIACSAARAGHQVFAVDCFRDLDLESCAIETAQIPRDQAEDLISTHVDRVHPDAIVLGPGLEEIQLKSERVLNNPPKKVSMVSDKLWMARWLQRQGFPFIKTELSADGLQSPILVKPRKGAGGYGCRLVKNAAELNWAEGFVAQDFIAGEPASVSVIGNGHEARAVAVNEQLVGAKWAGASDFRYVGNITPLECPSCGIAKMAERIVAALGLLGSNGVDFLLTERGPVVVEVNPRFQGSLDTVEMATGINIFQSHLEAFAGILPRRPRACCTAGRAIIYADRNFEVGKDLRDLGDWIADIPRPGSQIAAGDPILSILARGRNRYETLALLMQRAARLDERIKFLQKES